MVAANDAKVDLSHVIVDLQLTLNFHLEKLKGITHSRWYQSRSHVATHKEILTINY